jgi:hypothetical protein
MADKAKAQVVSNAIHAGILGLGVGAAGRGVQGLLNQMHRTLTPTPTTRTPSIIDMPVAGEEEEKVAAEGILNQILDYGMHPAKNLSRLVENPKAPGAADVPFSWAPLALAGGAGIAGGWKGLDMLLDRSRERELEVQKAKAQEEYEQALAAQSKVGQALHAELDTLFDNLDDDERDNVEKAASLPALLTNLYSLYALPAAGMSGLWAYEATKARQRSSLLESARKKYRRTRESQRPTPVYVRPTPVAGGDTMKSAPDEEELEGSPLDKAAGQGLIMSFVR